MAKNPNSAAFIQLDQLAKDLSDASGDKFSAVAKNLVIDTANQVQQFAMAYAPVRTGALRESITILITNGGLGAVISPHVGYQVFVEFGTGTRGEFPGHPIVITPKKAKVLRFVVNGRVVYAKKVVSPGMAPRPYMRPAAERVAEPLARGMGDNAVIFVVRGPNAPETLTNAPATSSAPSSDNSATSHGLVGRLAS